MTQMTRFPKKSYMADLTLITYRRLWQGADYGGIDMYNERMTQLGLHFVLNRRCLFMLGTGEIERLGRRALRATLTD